MSISKIPIVVVILSFTSVAIVSSIITSNFIQYARANEKCLSIQSSDGSSTFRHCSDEDAKNNHDLKSLCRTFNPDGKCSSSQTGYGEFENSP